MRLKVFMLASCILILSALTGCSADKKEGKEAKLLEYSNVYFNVTEDLYYPVRIPADMQYTTDNAKYIYADGDVERQIICTYFCQIILTRFCPIPLVHAY